ncbi:hypothetical protein J437_LFUL002219 [Ladona fulva]|uniref:Kazal-like domain-containing protein n=1 Tax=Ladona fulva TaxID=123851 RepID=A0A8K0JZT1_LADFU|nr:hypothetical protein J437_LFUL002219 [Ladona fulva]
MASPFLANKKEKVALAALLLLSTCEATTDTKCPVKACRRDLAPFCGIRADGSKKDIRGTCDKQRYECGELDETFQSIEMGFCSERNG